MIKQASFSINDSLLKLQKSLENLAPSLESEINQAVKNAAYSAYASIVAKAQAELSSTRQDYLKGLSIDDLGDNSFVISLDDEWANKLEEGFSSFNMTTGMLASDKNVQVGKRAGQPWVQQSQLKGKGEESHKFASVPFQRNPFSKASKTSDLAAAIREMTGKGINGIDQRITKLYTGPEGNPLEGKVAVGRSNNPQLDGLVKYQKKHVSESGKETVKAIYINYRTVSENGKPWIHPGYSGLKAFEDAEKDIVKNIDKIIASFL